MLHGQADNSRHDGERLLRGESQEKLRVQKLGQGFIAFPTATRVPQLSSASFVSGSCGDLGSLPVFDSLLMLASASAIQRVHDFDTCLSFPGGGGSVQRPRALPISFLALPRLTAKVLPTCPWQVLQRRSLHRPSACQGVGHNRQPSADIPLAARDRGVGHAQEACHPGSTVQMAAVALPLCPLWRCAADARRFVHACLAHTAATRPRIRPFRL